MWTVVHEAVYPGLFVSRLLIYGEAICCFPEEGSKKSSRKPGYEMWYFWASDAVEIGMVVVWISFRLDDILPSSGKCLSSSTIK